MFTVVVYFLRTRKMIIVYASDSEIIVCDHKEEIKTIQDYFEHGGRSSEDYDRIEYDQPLVIKSRLCLK